MCVSLQEIVHVDKQGKHLSLREVFQTINVNPDLLNVDALGVHADESTYQRFDNFNLKYNPFGDSLLRSVFMKTENHLKGRYFAEVARSVRWQVIHCCFIFPLNCRRLYRSSMTWNESDIAHRSPVFLCMAARFDFIGM